MQTMNEKTGGLAAAGLLAAAAVAAACDVRLRNVKYTIESGKVDSRVRLVFASDLHGALYGRDQRRLLAAIDACRPDILLLGGDIFDKERSGENSQAFIRGAAGRYPCCFVTGNHEFRCGNSREIKAYLRGHGITVLEGCCSTQEIRGQKINICGVDDPEVNIYGESEGSFRAQLEAAGKACTDGIFTVLLSHRPEYIKLYAKYGFDLVLSGHAHGGQWRLPGIIDGIYAPGQGLFPKYAGSLHTADGTRLIVGRGLSLISPPVPRLFNRPELVTVDIVPTAAAQADADVAKARMADADVPPD
jgi:uncharacterized protein